jgi:hypothetical protein
MAASLHWWICLFLGTSSLAQDKSLAVLEGNVINGLTKEPVRKARVILEPPYGDHSPALVSIALVSITDDAGHFKFADVHAARYWLRVEKSGFLDGAFRARTPEERGSLLTVADGDQMKDLNLQLFPAGSISGRVVDADGDPLPGLEVGLWRRSGKLHDFRDQPQDSTVASHTGEYRFDGLDPGVYYLSAKTQAPAADARQLPVDSNGKISKLRDLVTYYPAALSLEDAQGVTIEIGREQSGADIRMQRGLTFSIKGKIEKAPGSVLKYSLTTGYASAVPLPNGDFVVKDLPPGKHKIALLETGANGRLMVGSTEVTLTDRDATGVTITPYKPAEIRVRVVIEGEEDTPVTTAAMKVQPVDEIGGFFIIGPQNGVYISSYRTPGKYHAEVYNVDCCFLKSFRSGDQTLDPESFDVPDGAVLDILMTFSRDVASLTGDVEAPQDQSVHVLLIATETSKSIELTLDQTLHFSNSKLRPGKYWAFAAEDPDADLWDNPDFVKAVQSQGNEIDLHEKEQANIHLKLIPKDETDRIRKQLGL